MALSRRDWNNVIIYSVLAMLMLFYFVPQPEYDHTVKQAQRKTKRVVGSSKKAAARGKQAVKRTVRKTKAKVRKTAARRR